MRALDLSLSQADFERICIFMKESAGICFEESSRQVVFSRLSSLVVESGFGGFSEYLDSVFLGSGSELRQRFVCALTTNTTRFFREPDHFSLLESELMPSLVDKALRGEKVRIWSAACSSGEEAYSLAAVVVNFFPGVLDYDFKILASDIDTDVLGAASTGSYLQPNLAEVPRKFVNVLFESYKPGRPALVNSDLKRLIHFRRLNLFEQWPMQGRFDVVFCRNVAIYMDKDCQSILWAKFRDILEKGGGLFIGHSERLGAELSSSFRQFGHTAFVRI